MVAKGSTRKSRPRTVHVFYAAHKKASITGLTKNKSPHIPE